jgi:hypothetical protein
MSRPHQRACDARLSGDAVGHRILYRLTHSQQVILDGLVLADGSDNFVV